MKTYTIRNTKEIRLSGRYNPDEPNFPLMWSSSSIDMKAEASQLEIEIECSYNSMAPYLSFTVDGVVSQNFVPLKGKHWYPVFLNLAHCVHSVRIAKETQPFGGDWNAFVSLCRVRTNGKLLPMEQPKMKIEFIGDSITSGEGCKGPVSFMEWVPMVFSSSDTYTKMTADALKAQFHVISQSGWGVLGAWDNNPSGSIPKIYEKVCGPVGSQGAQKGYDFSFHPDKIVIALGTNDSGAMNNAPYTDPDTGIVHKLTDSAEDQKRLENGALSFIRLLHDKNPNADLCWVLFFDNGPVYDPISRAVQQAKEDGISIEISVPLTLDGMKKQDMGSRSHPGLKAHQKISKALVKLLRN